MINLWASLFSDAPASVVMLAINKIIGTSQYPPSVAEVKEKISTLYYEALEELPYQHGGLYCNNTDELPTERIALLKDVLKATKPKQERVLIEPSKTHLTDNADDRKYIISANFTIDT